MSTLLHATLDSSFSSRSSDNLLTCTGLLTLSAELFLILALAVGNQFADANYPLTVLIRFNPLAAVFTGLTWDSPIRERRRFSDTLGLLVVRNPLVLREII